MRQEEMWNAYRHINPAAERYEAWAFGGDTPEAPDQLAALVLAGVKTATASAYDCYAAEGSPLPQAGAYSMILNRAEEAVCVIRTTKVTIVPFSQVTAEHAYQEGEFDRSLAAWRTCHQAVFAMELQELGKAFSEDMLVVCEEFEVVYPVRAAE